MLPSMLNDGEEEGFVIYTWLLGLGSGSFVSMYLVYSLTFT